MTLTAEQANAVYSILSEECGAPDDHMGFDIMGFDRYTFVNYFITTTFPEWRFGGWLGFGGKCRINSNHPVPHVDCYPEDETPERLAMIERANARIKELFE